MTILDAYRILSDAYPEAVHPISRLPMKRLNGKAKLRALATVIQSDGDLAEAMAMITDPKIRGMIRDGLLPMLTFTPAASQE